MAGAPVRLNNTLVVFDEQKYALEYSRYANPRNIRITFNDVEDGSVELTATTNCSLLLPDGYVLIKNWQENEGVQEALMEAGVVGPQTSLDQWVPFPVHRLLLRPEGPF